MYFVRIEYFQQMEFVGIYQSKEDDKTITLGKDINSFVGFNTCVQFFKHLDHEITDFIYKMIKMAIESLKTYSESHNRCYSHFPLCIVTQGYTGINCYRENKKTLYYYDSTKWMGNITTIELKNSLVCLEFWKDSIAFINGKEV